MSETKNSFLDDDRGNPSSMRLMSMLALIASIAFGVITIVFVDEKQTSTGLYITTSFLIAAFAPKALQKFAETKLGGTQ